MICSAALLTIALVAPTVPGETWIVDSSGAADFTRIQDAVDAAASGDVILVLDFMLGATTWPQLGYEGFVVRGKSLTIVSDPGSAWSIDGVTIRDLDRQQVVVLHGLPIGGEVEIVDCQGAVRCDSLRRGARAVIEVRRSRDVTFGGCDLLGGISREPVERPLLHVFDSRVSIAASSLTGVDGYAPNGFSCDPGQGAHAVVVEGSSVLRVEGSELQGGNAMFGFSCPSNTVVRGGSGLVNGGSARVWLRDAVTVGGAALPSGTAPAIIGPVMTSAAVPRVVSMGRLGRAGVDLPVEVHGLPGDSGFLVASEATLLRILDVEVGALHVARPLLGGPYGVAATLPTGAATVRVPLDPVAPDQVSVVHVQVFVRDAAGVLYGSPVRTAIRIGAGVPVGLDGEVVHVDPNHPPGGDGATWATALSTLEGALARALGRPDAPVQVWAKGGTFRANRFTVNSGITQRHGVDVLGGFEGHETHSSERSLAAPWTVLSGDTLANDHLPGGRLENTWTLWTFAPADPHAVASPRVDRLDRVEFRSGGRGIGGYTVNVNRPMDIDRCRFVDNRANAVLWDRGQSHAVRLTSCELVGNQASAAQLMGVQLEQCVVAGNRSWTGNSTLHLGPSSRVVQCTIVDNVFMGFGVGGSAVSHHAPSGGPPPTGRLANSIVWGNHHEGQPPVATSQVEGLPFSAWAFNDVQGFVGPVTGGNLSMDPRFVDRLGPDGQPGTGDEDYRLAAGSPCVDRGDNSELPAGLLLDLDGRRRRIDDPAAPNLGAGTPPLVDLGTYER